MRKATIITGPPASGKSLKARELAQLRGRFVTAQWGDSFERFTTMRPDAIIVEEVPHPLRWPATAWSNFQLLIKQAAAPHLIFVLNEPAGQLPAIYFEVIRMGAGGPGRGQGNKLGRTRKDRLFVKCHPLSQRYTDTEKRLLESVAGGDVGQFIHDAAVDRAQQFADQGVQS